MLKVGIINMATIDNVVRNVPIFDGDLKKGRLNYERASQGLELIEEACGLLEETIKAETGFDAFNLPEDQQTTKIERGDVVFNVVSQARTRKPQYKTAVTQMENYLTGISWLLAEGRAITGVVKVGRNAYVTVDSLLQNFDIIVRGILVPEVKHTIRYEARGKLVTEVARDEIKLAENRWRLNAENAANYVRVDRIREGLAAYVKAYEQALAAEAAARGQGEQVVAVTQKAAYRTRESSAEGVKWVDVVSTLVKVSTIKKSVGELNILADYTISLVQKQRDMPWYQLKYREVGNDKVLYVAIASVYDRIQQLKGEKATTARRFGVEGKVIV
jgi:hypothetical protein